MTKKLAKILNRMSESGDSADTTVAEYLSTIAENDDGQEKNDFLKTCVEELRDSAQASVSSLSPQNRSAGTPLTHAERMDRIQNVLKTYRATDAVWRRQEVASSPLDELLLDLLVLAKTYSIDLTTRLAKTMNTEVLEDLPARINGGL